MRDYLLVIGFFAVIFIGMALAEFLAENFATELGVIFFSSVFYGLYRAGRFFWGMR